ncbi:MAG TPA: MBL fold metallo-hydrolase [Atribacterota bacterium]|nr:MBL fold metallo-hydrolase [Atribacterota bacterium]
MNNIKKYFLPIFILLFLLSFTAHLFAQDTVSIYFLDVGQGDASIIITPDDRVVMIDSGTNESLILSYLQNLGISQIDLLIATHAHADHITGMDKIIARYKPKAFIDPGIPHTTATYQRMITAIDKFNINYYEGISRKINLGSLSLTILPPAIPLIKGSELNNNSVVVRLDYKDFSCLFTGDIEKGREGQFLIRSDNILKVDILKIAHHGSSSSSSPLFIKSVGPKIAVICCGQDNKYGHPHQETISLLQSLGIEIYRTDLNGTILIKTDGKDYQIFTEKESIRAPPVVKTETKTTEAQEYKYAASKNSDIFHYIDCSYVKKIKPEDLILFKTREEAIASGRRPCKKCSP